MLQNLNIQTTYAVCPEIASGLSNPTMLCLLCIIRHILCILVVRLNITTSTAVLVERLRIILRSNASWNRHATM